MKTVWKVLLGLALAVPMVAYVAGSVVASASDDPPRRETIVIPARTPSPSSHSTPTPSPTQQAADDVEVITPDFEDDDDHDDRGDDDHGDDHNGGDDSSGHGSGHDDDHSGHGGED